MSQPIRHPYWCHAEWCTVAAAPLGGSHQSRPVVIERPMARFEVSLLQGLPMAGNPRADVLLVDLTVTELAIDPQDEDVTHGFTLSAADAEQLSLVLVNHGRRAAG